MSRHLCRMQSMILRTSATYLANFYNSANKVSSLRGLSIRLHITTARYAGD